MRIKLILLYPRELEISIYNPIANRKLDTKLINNFFKKCKILLMIIDIKNIKSIRMATLHISFFDKNSKHNFITINFYNYVPG